MDTEIRQDIKLLREGLLDERRKLGPSPLTLQSTIQWNNSMKEFEHKLRLVNKKIDKFNIIVPILNKQKVHVNFQKEVHRTVEHYGYGTTEETEFHLNSQEESKHKGNSTTLTFIGKLFEKYRERFLRGSTENGRT